MPRVWRRRLPLLAAAFAALLALASAAGAQGTLPAAVRIGLATGQSTLILILPAGTALHGPGGKLWQTAAGCQITLTAGANGTIRSGAADLGRGPLRLAGGNGLLGWGQRTYRGSFLIQPDRNGLTLCNEIGLDDYLRGVLPAEVNPAWPAEALKAQAVAARTYTLGRLGHHRGDGFDLCATTHCQVYRGAGEEAPATDAAVAATRGQVLTYGGRLISAYYHAASGGHTEDVEHVWQGAAPLPYLRGVPDPAETSPYGQWQVELAWAAVEEAVRAQHPEIGRLTAIEILERTAAGRVCQLRLTGDRGTAVLRGEEGRWLFSLQSSFFDLQVECAPLPVARPEALLNAPVQYTLAPGSLGQWRDAFAGGLALVPMRLRITGRGWGHGVGMSQWGAKSLAELGYTHTMILKYYYQGVEVEDWRPPQESPPGEGDGAGAD